MTRAEPDCGARVHPPTRRDRCWVSGVSWLVGAGLDRVSAGDSGRGLCHVSTPATSHEPRPLADRAAAWLLACFVVGGGAPWGGRGFMKAKSRVEEERPLTRVAWMPWANKSTVQSVRACCAVRAGEGPNRFLTHDIDAGLSLVSLKTPRQPPWRTFSRSRFPQSVPLGRRISRVA